MIPDYQKTLIKEIDKEYQNFLNEVIAAQKKDEHEKKMFSQSPDVIFVWTSISDEMNQLLEISDLEKKAMSVHQ